MYGEHDHEVGIQKKGTGPVSLGLSIDVAIDLEFSVLLSFSSSGDTQGTGWKLRTHQSGT
jgi:hypothetical protein